jgi:Protein of unknown function (DUF3775)
VLKAITPSEVREIAGLATRAREAQEKLLDKLRVLDRGDDGKMIEQEITSSNELLDATLDNKPLQELKDRLASLDDEARHELLAVSMIGGGVYGPTQWDDALNEARAMHGADEVERIAEPLELDERLARGLFELAQA